MIWEGEIMQGLLLLNAIVPLVMTLVGAILKKCPVSDMRSQNGYNTPVSRRSQRHWDYAQEIAPGIFISMGKGLLLLEAVISIVLLMLGISVVTAVIVGTVIGFVALFGTFFYTDSRIVESVEEDSE